MTPYFTSQRRILEPETTKSIVFELFVTGYCFP
jgi:hypothetical protein